MDVFVGHYDAILRPLSGNLEKVEIDGEWVVQLATDSMRVAKMQTWEFWERAGKLGSSIHASGDGGSFAITRKDLFSNYQEPEIKESTIDTVFFLSKTCLALLLIGHAGFGFAVEKQMLINHWQSIGVDADVSFITNVGYGEFALGVLIFLAPVKPLIFIALLWKLFTEFLYVPADTVAGMGIVNVFEWIERWGDYGIPVVMLYILSYKQAKAVN